jgi:hypothetical protein
MSMECPPSQWGWAGVLSFDWRPLLIAAWGLVLLYPVRETGYLDDDFYNASLPGLWIYSGTTPLTDAYVESMAWIAGGRINPVIHFWKDAMWWLFRDLYWYKWAQVVAVVVSLVVFYRCLRTMGAEANLAALTCILTTGLIQFRALCDPVLAFNFLMPGLLTLTALSLSLLRRHLVTGGWLALAGSVLLYSAAVLTYEMTYTFWLLHAWATLRSRPGWVRGVLTLLPFAGVPILLTLGSLLIRSHQTDANQPYAIKSDIAGIADTFAKQAIAALPCSSAALDHTVPLASVFSWNTFAHYFAVLGLAALLFGLLAGRLIRRAREGGLGLRGWAALGLLLAVLPIPMLSLASKYQGAFDYGFGYLPVYIEYFGVALLMAVGVAAFGRLGWRLPAGLLALAVALPCAAFTVFDYAGNIEVVHTLSVPILHPRCEVEEVLDAGLLHRVKAGDALVIDRLFPWEPGRAGIYFYCCHTHTRLADVLAPCDGGDALSEVLPDRPDDHATPNAMRLRYFHAGAAGGFAVAGRLCYARLGPDGTLCESGLSVIRLAVWRGGQWDPLSDRPFVFHSAYRPDGDPARPAVPVALASEELRRVATTDHWTIYEIEAPYPYLEGEAARLEFAVAGTQAHAAGAAPPP